MKTLLTYTVIAFLASFSQQSLSETDFFNSVDLIGGGTSPLPTVNATYETDINFEALKEFPQILNLVLPDQLPSSVPVMSFDPRAGYIFKDDETDPPDSPPFWPNPNISLDEFSYLWTGSNDDYDVVITVNEGRLLARIYGSEKIWF